MIRVSLTGILVLLGITLVLVGALATVSASTWAPVCHLTEDLRPRCLHALVGVELASSKPSVEAKDLLAWCGADQLCRLDVLNARPPGDSHAERALCEIWTPDFKLSCEQGIQSRVLGVR